eukprot:1377078-Pyramimonas_sp.AAC.1
MAKEFGSRADMISPKIDEVSRNSIWREHCKKELANHTLNTNFNIANINKSTPPVASCVMISLAQRSYYLTSRS